MAPHIEIVDLTGDDDDDVIQLSPDAFSTENAPRPGACDTFSHKVKTQTARRTGVPVGSNSIPFKLSDSPHASPVAREPLAVKSDAHVKEEPVKDSTIDHATQSGYEPIQFLRWTIGKRKRSEELLPVGPDSARRYILFRDGPGQTGSVATSKPATESILPDFRKTADHESSTNPEQKLETQASMSHAFKKFIIEVIKAEEARYSGKMPQDLLERLVVKVRDTASSLIARRVRSILKRRNLHLEPNPTARDRRKLEDRVKNLFLETARQQGRLSSRGPSSHRSVSAGEINTCHLVSHKAPEGLVNGHTSKHYGGQPSPHVDRQDTMEKTRPTRTSAHLASRRISAQYTENPTILHSLDPGNVPNTSFSLSRTSSASRPNNAHPNIDHALISIVAAEQENSGPSRRPIPSTWDDADELDRFLMMQRAEGQSFYAISDALNEVTGTRISRSTLNDRHFRLEQMLGKDYIHRHASMKAVPQQVSSPGRSVTYMPPKPPYPDPESTISCPFPNIDGSDCNKTCSGSSNSNRIFQHMMSHIQQKHPERNVVGIPNTREGFQQLVDAASSDALIQRHIIPIESGETASPVDFVVRCPLRNSDGLRCETTCTDSNAHRSIVDHIRKSASHVHYRARIPQTTINADNWDDIVADLLADDHKLLPSLPNDTLKMPEHPKSGVEEAGHRNADDSYARAILVPNQSNAIICPLIKADAKECGKTCLGKTRYQDMISHIRQSHPERYIKHLPATEESLLRMLRNVPSNDSASTTASRGLPRAERIETSPPLTQPKRLDVDTEVDHRDYKPQACKSLRDEANIPNHSKAFPQILQRQPRGQGSSQDTCISRLFEKSAVRRAHRQPKMGSYQESLAAHLALTAFRHAKSRNQPHEYEIHEDDQMRLLKHASMLKYVECSVPERDNRPDKPFAKTRSSVNHLTNPLEASVGTVGDNRLEMARPSFIMLESEVQDPCTTPAKRIDSLLRRREFGSSNAGRHFEPKRELSMRSTEAIKPWRWWTGASHDVVTVAWAPDSISYATGAVAHSNDEDLQYNRPCNLLLGDLRTNTLKELPDHRIDRPIPKSGPNASIAMYDACDPKVYKTVTSVMFHPQGTELYSSSEDQTVKVWDMGSQTCVRTLHHDAAVTNLEASPSLPGAFATGSRTSHNAIRVYSSSGTYTSFSSSRAEQKPDWKIYPECLQWGPAASTNHLLVSGFQQEGNEDDAIREGHLCLWDTEKGQEIKVTPNSQAIHTLTWHPMMPLFATGGAPGSKRTDRYNTQTIVRIFDVRSGVRHIMEYECRALEMTDVTFHPIDSHIVTAGCTNSTSYVWDFRWPEDPIHTLRHRKSVMPSGERDTGVMMSLWGPTASLYYSGSSDGSVFAWDVRRAPEDVHVSTVAHIGAGIQSGSFSPDGSHLLLGDATGGVHMLSSAPWAPQPDYSDNDDDVARKGALINIIRAPDGSGSSIDVHQGDNPGTEGIQAAKQLVDEGAIVIDPDYGPGKGPKYREPVGACYREPPFTDMESQTGIGRLKKDIYRVQPFSRSGKVREEYAYPIRALVAARRYNLDLSRSPILPDTIAEDEISSSQDHSERDMKSSALSQAKSRRIKPACEECRKFHRRCKHPLDILDSVEDISNTVKDNGLANVLSFVSTDRRTEADSSDILRMPPGMELLRRLLTQVDAKTLPSESSVLNRLLKGESLDHVSNASTYEIKYNSLSELVCIAEVLLDKRLGRRLTGDECKLLGDLESWSSNNDNSERQNDLIQAWLDIAESTDNDDHDDLPEDEMLEEDHWWPFLGEDDITQAREKMSQMRME